MIQHIFMLNLARVSWLSVAAMAVLSGGAGWIAAEHISLRPQAESEIITTLDKIRSRPNDYSGKRVRLTGQLDECYFWECSLCPEKMTNKSRNADRCLALSFQPLVNGTGFGSREQENLFRFSSVVLSARFDPSCWEGGCPDRQVVLFDATISAVTKRRAGASGLWVTNANRLIPLNGRMESRMVAAARLSGYGDKVPVKAFATEDSNPRLVVCWSSPFSEKEPGSWPLTFESALYAKSTLDFFHCNEVRDVDGQMIVQASA